MQSRVSQCQRQGVDRWVSAVLPGDPRYQLQHTAEEEGGRRVVQAEDPHPQMQCPPHIHVCPEGNPATSDSSTASTSLLLTTVSVVTTSLNRREYLVSVGNGMLSA